MTDKPEMDKGFSLARWSRRKLEAARDTTPPVATAPAAPAPTVTGAPATPAPIELPPVESLTFDSDFTAFLRPEVDADLKRAALKQLFRDPRFNVMDGLDTYIDDYTKADPIPSDMLAGLLQRFARVAATDETSAVGAGERESADAPVDISPASDGENTTDVHQTGEADAPLPAHDEARVGPLPDTGNGTVPSTEDDAQATENKVVSPPARNDTR